MASLISGKFFNFFPFNNPVLITLFAYICAVFSLPATLKVSGFPICLKMFSAADLGFLDLLFNSNISTILLRALSYTSGAGLKFVLSKICLYKVVPYIPIFSSNDFLKASSRVLPATVTAPFLSASKSTNSFCSKENNSLFFPKIEDK